MIKNQVILRVHLDVEKRGRESYVEKNGHNESLTVLSTTLPLFLYIGPLSHVYLTLRKRKHSFFLFWGLVGCVCGSGVSLLLRKIKIYTKASLFNEDLTPNEEGGMAFPYIYTELRLQPMVLWLCFAYGPFKRLHFYTMAPSRKISRLHHS